MNLTINTRLSKMKETFILTGGVSTKVSTWYMELDSWGVISMCGVGIRGSFIMLLVSVKFSANIWRSRGHVCAKASNLSQACWKQRKPLTGWGHCDNIFYEMAALAGAHDDRPRDGTGKNVLVLHNSSCGGVSVRNCLFPGSQSALWCPVLNLPLLSS